MSPVLKQLRRYKKSSISPLAISPNVITPKDCLIPPQNFFY